MLIFEKFIKVIQEQRMLKRGERVLIGVSGGPDSVALLHLLIRVRARYELELIVGHFNHKLRGEASDEDEEFVRGVADSCGLRCLTASVPSSERWTCQQGSLENWARQKRYEFFWRMSVLHQITKVALGHTMDDQAETVLMRLIRGSGTLGLAAIPFVREGLFIRPLLRVKRGEILDFLAQQHVEYREDSSNADQGFLRNRIRGELLPDLASKYNPKIVELLSTTAEILREDSEALAILAEEVLDSQAVITEEGIAWDLGHLLKLSRGLQKNVLRHSVMRLKGNLDAISANDIARILDLASEKKGGRSFRIGDIQIRREFGRLYLAGNNVERGDYRYELRIPGQVRLAETRSLFECYTEPRLPALAISTLERWEFYLSFEEAMRGVWIRNWRSGDAYHPVGASRVKKIKELFAQKRIPRHLRSAWPVFGIDDKIIFAKGFPVSADRSVKADCKRNLKVVVEERKLNSETVSSLIHRRTDS